MQERVFGEYGMQIIEIKSIRPLVVDCFICRAAAARVRVSILEGDLVFKVCTCQKCATEPALMDWIEGQKTERSKESE